MNSASFGVVFQKLVLSVLLVLLVSACGTKSRYSMEHDIGPEGTFDASGVPDAVPAWEPLSRQGNKSPYRVRGIEYHLADVSKGFSETGIASWYGLKFHGELTSNGETYNMYAMSAAHKHLPIPSYVRVTNLDNKRSVVVRVNDRGPFHQGRVIDLSYAAATKLGYAKKGTARVRVDIIKPENLNADSVSSAFKSDRISHFIQVAAFSQKKSAERLLAQLNTIPALPSKFVASQQLEGRSIFRVRLGPFTSQAQADSALLKLKSEGFKGAHIIQRALSAKNI